jgi:hypothetical protein
VNLAATCETRGAAACVTYPKVALLMFPFTGVGAEKLGMIERIERLEADF